MTVLNMPKYAKEWVTLISEVRKWSTIKQGVAMTGHNTTGPPGHRVLPRGELCCAVECYRCQRTKLTDTVRSKQYCPPHDTMCSRARNKLSNQRQYLNSTAHSYHLVSRNAVDEFGSREIVLHLFPQCWYTTAST